MAWNSTYDSNDQSIDSFHSCDCVFSVPMNDTSLVPFHVRQDGVLVHIPNHQYGTTEG